MVGVGSSQERGDTRRGVPSGEEARNSWIRSWVQGDAGLRARRGMVLQVSGGERCSTCVTISSTLGEEGVVVSLAGFVVRWVLAKWAEAARKVRNSREHSEHVVGVCASKVLWTFLAWILKLDVSRCLRLQTGHGRPSFGKGTVQCNVMVVIL